MKEHLLSPEEIFNKIDSISICKTSFINWCKEAERTKVEELKQLIQDKHTSLALHARNLQSSNASEEDIESALYELTYFMLMYKTANQVIELHHPLN